jgi:lipoprotein-releasing system ATP-binding protein
MSDFLAARDLVKEYVQGDEKLRVLRGVSLNVREGEFLVVVGASGAGKSTLLHLLGLLDSPTTGEVLLEGKSLTRLTRRQQARLRSTLFGFVFQFFHLLPDFSAVENVMMPALVRYRTLEWTRRRKEMRARARDLLARVGLKERLRHRPNQLSGGERQRVALCRALINQPRVLLLDEPTGHLDRKTGEQIHQLIHEINRAQRQTIVMVTHDESAAQAAGRLLRIRDGELIG